MKQKKDSFWLSYSDLMTSLFFIMLVLFIVCVIAVRPVTVDSKSMSNRIAQLEKELSALKKDKAELEKTNLSLSATNEQLQSILQLEEQFKALSSSSTLRYDENKKTFLAKDLEGIEIFKQEDDVIKQEYRDRILGVGRDLEQLLSELHRSHPEFGYLLVIEGTSANDAQKSMSRDRPYNYQLSFNRAMALYNFWNQSGINLRKYNTEIQICGSGLNGINRDNTNEANNKRFVLQIIPKISRPVTKK